MEYRETRGDVLKRLAGSRSPWSWQRSDDCSPEQSPAEAFHGGDAPVDLEPEKKSAENVRGCA